MNKTALGRVGKGDRTLSRNVKPYRSISWDSWDENGQAQPHLELELVKGMSGNRGISTATLAAEGGLLLTSDTVMKDTEKTKGFSPSPASAFLAKSAQSLLSGLPGLCIAAPAQPPVPLRWRGAPLGLLMGSVYLSSQWWPVLTRGQAVHRLCWVTASSGEWETPSILPKSRVSLSHASKSNRFISG